MEETRPRVLGMSMDDIIRVRMKRPFNLPQDPHSYPTFLSFEARHDYLIRSLLRSFLKILNRQRRETNGESDSSDEDEVDKIMDEFGSSDEDEEEYESEGEADYERRQIMATMQPALKFRDLGMDGGRRGRGGRGVHGARGRGEHTSSTGRMHEPEHMDIPEEFSDMGKKRELKITNLIYPPLDSAESSSNPGRAKRQRVGDPDSPESTGGNRGMIPHAGKIPANSIEPTSVPGEGTVWPKLGNRGMIANAGSLPVNAIEPTPVPGEGMLWPKLGNRGMIANAGSLPANSMEPTSVPEEGMVWPTFQRPIGFTPSPDEILSAKKKETTSVKKPKTEPSSWDNVYKKLPAISCGDVKQDYRIKQELVKHMIVGSLPTRRKKRIEPYMDDIDITFVGEQYPMKKFSPWRGDLIIVPRSGRPQPSYLESYMGEEAIEKRRFTNGELVLRIGHFNTVDLFGYIGNAQFPGMLFPNDFEYEPYSWVSLFACNPMATNLATQWKFLGHQMELDNAQISHPPYESQGKFLKVGDQVLDYTQFEPIVPRRGDVIIKREAWDANFRHDVNFWYSMVKWHRGTQFPFVVGDLLVRRFIDNQYNEQKTLNIPRNTFLWGWAELYEYHDFHSSGHSWIFWGRTKHWYDIPTSNQAHEVIKYTCDQGIDTEDDMEYEMVNPRRYIIGKKQDHNIEQQPKEQTS